jgi:2-polyprenyl-6-hydroxyphenyl methylase/3-demethylubiquinone-9 3-methyltransferase
VSQHAKEVIQKRRFEFGRNWRLFLGSLNDDRIAAAEDSLRRMLGVKNLCGRKFLDAGSGSGLFSLAARRMGAIVHSFDFDPESVACAEELKYRYFPEDANWRIEEGSVTDRNYVAGLGKYDIVYSWGVLHHSGSMWTALDNIIMLVADGGQLYISIYNRQPFMSSYWSSIKRLYNRSPYWARLVLAGYFYLFFAAGLALTDILRSRNPLYRHGGRERRGMSFYRDIVDWIGGWPFEVASPEEVFQFCRDRGFSLIELKTVGGKHGCNEFVLLKRFESTTSLYRQAAN